MDLSSHEGELPIPISTSYVTQSHGILHHSSNGPPPLTSEQEHHHHHHHPQSATVPYTKKAPVLVKYRECLKNHAASIGGNATDGCGEFMPSGEEGTIEALKCSACNCHRNFHRKETEGDLYHHPRVGGRELMLPRPTPHNMIMPLGVIQTSESDEMEGVGHGGGYPRPPMMKKRFRTKFSAEQKEKMLAFAEKAGWKLQKQEESVVQQFCQEIGVKRRVLKVWMHNNKHNLAKKAAATTTSSSLNERMDEQMNE